MIKKVMISIDEPLHEQATKHARDVHHTGFSGLVVKLIVADLALYPTAIPQPPPLTPADIERAEAAIKKHKHGKHRPKDSGPRSGR